MAVQQNKKTRSKRGMRRAHDALCRPALSQEEITGDLHYRHQLTREGFYRGRRIEGVWRPKKAAESEAQEELQQSAQTANQSQPSGKNPQTQERAQTPQDKPRGGGIKKIFSRLNKSRKTER